MDMAIEVSACSWVAGKGVHSSNTMVMVESRKRWISMERSGVSRYWVPSRCERNVTPFLVECAQFPQRHDLEAAGIGQDRAWPIHHAVQPAQFSHPLGAGPQHEVIGVAEHDAGSGAAHGIGRHGFDGGRGADGHEGGGGHLAMGGAQRPWRAPCRRWFLFGPGEAGHVVCRCSRVASP